VADYVVVLAAESDLRFRDSELPLRVLAVPTAAGAVDITIQTRHADEGYEAGVPRELWLDVRGASDSDDFVSVVTAYANAAAGFLPIISLANNAYIGDLEPKIAFDATLGKSERRFFQNFLPEEHGTLPRPWRVAKVKATRDVLQALDDADRDVRDRVLRAAAQYAYAVRNWKWGDETLALAHLYIGTEAVLPLAVRRECDREGCDVDELARRLEIDERRSHLRRTKVDAEIRRRILFRGDTDTLRAAKKASDGFEHAFLDFALVRDLAVAARDQTARYLRASVFDFLQVPGDAREALEEAPYDTPLRSFYSRYMWGALVGDSDELAAPRQEYPMLTWRSRLVKWAAAGDSYDAAPEEIMTPRIADALQFRRDRFEVWGAAGVDVRAGEERAEDDGSLSPPTQT
jgi:hypothetical protein